MSTRIEDRARSSAEGEERARTAVPDGAAGARLRPVDGGAEPRRVPPAAAETAAEPGPSARGSRRPIVLGVVGLVVLAGIGLGVKQWLFGLHHVSTDDAQVEGHIIPVLPKVAGYVTAVRVSENQRVNAGDLLVTLDDRDFVAKLAQNDADLRAAEAMTGNGRRPGQTEAQLAAARAAVAQAQANADRATRDAERYRGLAARTIISRQQLDAAEAAAIAARAQLTAARDQVAAAQAAVQGAAAKVSSNLAQREQAALQLTYTRVLAPSEGVVSRKNVEVGQYVQAGQPLMSVVPLDDIWVIANLRETEIRDIRSGDQAEIEVDSYPGRTFTGHVESLSPATGAKFSLLPPDNATGNFTKVVQRIPVKIRIDGGTDATHPLRPGMSVKAIVTTR